MKPVPHTNIFWGPMVVMFVLIAPWAVSAENVLSNQVLSFKFSRQDALFTVTDLRSGLTYRQQRFRLPETNVSEVTQKGNMLLVRLEQAGVSFEAVFRLEEKEAALSVELRADAKAQMKELVYPYPFVWPNNEGNLVWPLREGLLIPVAEDIASWPETARRMFRWAGFHMPWHGLTDLKRGVMALAETPHDMRFVAHDSPPALTFKWLGAFNRFGYTRRMTYFFFTTGGYVAMAKRYREYLKGIGWFRTLEEKAKVNPNVARLPGAVVLWWPSMPEDVIKDLVDSGVERVLIMGGTRGSDLTEKAGYLVGRYDNLVDIWPPDYPGRKKPLRDPVYAHHREGYPDECVQREDGSLLPGWRQPVGDKVYVCGRRSDVFKLAWAKRLIPADIERRRHNARYLDVETALRGLEDWSPQHRISRRKSIELRCELFCYVAEGLKQVLGSEDSRWWGNRYVSWCEGIEVIQNSGSFAKQMKKSPGPWPWDINGKQRKGWYFKTSREYRFLNYNARLRAPLFQLVFHDSVVGTWRWDAPANRFLDRETWDIEDLFNLLYATSPMFTLDTNLWPEARERILRTVRAVCDFGMKVAGQPMTKHRYLTADRLVQQSTFGNGWTVVVNFSPEQEYRVPGREAIPPRGYIAWKTAQGR
ncbi:MAG: hypothetical protein GXP25_13325 [Planctomycetes bacterium]|nr:hypothetical protein [Planctomycetota bacterium]